MFDDTFAVVEGMIQASLLIPTEIWQNPSVHTWCEVSDGVRSMKLGAEGDCGGEEEDDDDEATAAAAGTATADSTAAAFPLMNGAGSGLSTLVTCHFTQSLSVRQSGDRTPRIRIPCG